MRDRFDRTEERQAATNRVLRGGSWNNNTSNLRAAYRNNNNPSNRNNNNGFRCAKTWQLASSRGRTEDAAAKARCRVTCRSPACFSSRPRPLLGWGANSAYRERGRPPVRRAASVQRCASGRRQDFSAVPWE